ncbi:Uncharacterised protein [uncultured archaeon]|nr:Uncharacterised protein [uncultured archaeon]
MKIIDIENEKELVNIEEIELIHYGLAEYAGSEIKIEELKSLLNIELKNRQNIEFADNSCVKLIQVQRAFRMIIEALYECHKDKKNMKVRFE